MQYERVTKKEEKSRIKCYLSLSFLANRSHRILPTSTTNKRSLIYSTYLQVSHTRDAHKHIFITDVNMKDEKRIL